MTIDEAIEELKSENGYYANNGMTDVAEFNTKIIRLLEELKELRVTVSELQCEMQATGALLNERDKETRNKAIDDFAEKLLSAFDETNIKEYGFYPENLIMQVAKQLKAGGVYDD